MVTEFTFNLTNPVDMPSVEYINKLAYEKGFQLSNTFENCPKVLQDLYSIYKSFHDDPLEFDIKKELLPSKVIEQEILGGEMDGAQKSYYRETLKFLMNIDYEDMIGFGPMDKALRTMMILVKLSDATNPDQSDQKLPDDAAYAKENMITIADESQLHDAVKEQVKIAEGDPRAAAENAGDEDSKIMAQGEMAEKQPHDISREMTRCVRDHLYDLDPTIAHIYGYEKPSDIPINKQIFQDLEIKAWMEQEAGMETGMDVQKRRNNDSQERADLHMEELNQVTKLPKNKMVMPNFTEKLAKKEFTVKEKVKPKEKKQILYMIMDDSGSMCNIWKQGYVRATLMNRLEAVAKDEAELIFYKYLIQVYDKREAKDLKDCQELYREISLNRPNGGGTNIAACLQQIVDEIKSKEVDAGYHDPEIVLLCDGDDHMDPDNLDDKGVRISAVLLGTDNPGIEETVRRTDGFLIKQNFYRRY